MINFGTKYLQHQANIYRGASLGGGVRQGD